MDLETLEKMTVVKLREEAHKFDDIKGAVGMSKDQLIDVLCKKHGIERKHRIRKGIGRRALKERITSLKRETGDVMASGDRKKIRTHRRKLHQARHRLRQTIFRAARTDALAAAAKAKEAPPEPSGDAAPAPDAAPEATGS